VGASLPGFLVAALTSVVALFMLSIGIVGHFRGPLNLAERAGLIVSALVMAVFPIGLSAQGLLPLAIGALVTTRNIMAHRRTALP